MDKTKSVGVQKLSDSLKHAYIGMYVDRVGDFIDEIEKASSKTMMNYYQGMANASIDMLESFKFISKEKSEELTQKVYDTFFKKISELNKNGK